MFEIKYDRDGNPIRERAKIQELDKAAEENVEVNAAPVEVAAAPEQHFPEASEEPAEDVTQGSPDETHIEPTVTAHPTVEEDSDAKKSFRDIVKAKRQAERERDEYRKRIEEFESRGHLHRQAATTPKEQAEEDEAFHLGADDIAEGKHIAKVDKRAQDKIKALEERLQKYESKSAEEKAEALLRTKYTDFDKVVSRDNLEMLSEAYPELARTIHATDDLYTKAVSAYTLIKKFGIHQDSPLETLRAEKSIAQKNAAKPRPLTSVSPQQGETPLSRANAFASGLTDDLKAQLLKEMQSARKGY